MITSFSHKGLAELFAKGFTKKINPELHARILRRLEVLDQAETLRDLHLPGFFCHPLQGEPPKRYSISVNGPWRITFEWQDGNVLRADLEQYH
ncbi:type II toxin-antitoxin system RelE/ParE family toxin [Desulfonatronum lacustre]|uniref:type II toxin-antitoxin system RelE/ParE family toxin n=1 Tax=Desulfonatronum lacustre TaxID=66849 RepID=UPI00048DFFE4|nr:type II toxin-antitoxin system RelE/ParE family toxin [Desulfonatronum lacustre]